MNKHFDAIDKEKLNVYIEEFYKNSINRIGI